MLYNSDCACRSGPAEGSLYESFSKLQSEVPSLEPFQYQSNKPDLDGVALVPGGFPCLLFRQ